jgi:hypothetical protein
LKIGDKKQRSHELEKQPSEGSVEEMAPTSPAIGSPLQAAANFIKKIPPKFTSSHNLVDKQKQASGARTGSLSYGSLHMSHQESSARKMSESSPAVRGSTGFKDIDNYIELGT